MVLPVTGMCVEERDMPWEKSKKWDRNELQWSFVIARRWLTKARQKKLVDNPTKLKHDDSDLSVYVWTHVQHASSRDSCLTYKSEWPNRYWHNTTMGAVRRQAMLQRDFRECRYIYYSIALPSRPCASSTRRDERFLLERFLRFFNLCYTRKSSAVWRKSSRCRVILDRHVKRSIELCIYTQLANARPCQNSPLWLALVLP